MHLGGDHGAVPGPAHHDGHVVGGRGVIGGWGSEALVTRRGQGAAASHPGEAAYWRLRPVSLVCLGGETDTGGEIQQLVSSINIYSVNIRMRASLNTNLKMM